MQIIEIINFLESIAPPGLQESYDNTGLLIGSAGQECTGIIISLDVTEAVIEESLKKKCNLIVAHHPIIFKGLKKLNGKNYIERTVISAIKNDIAVYAIHTNLDNIVQGVNKKLAEKLNLQNCKVLLPKEGTLKKLVTFSPKENAEKVQNGLFKAGAGAVGKYSECSFNLDGRGTFKANEGARPFIGKIGERHTEEETRIEVFFPEYFQNEIIRSLKEVHPYEEVAYDIYSIDNNRDDIGSGLIGELSQSISEDELLKQLKLSFGLSVIKHTNFLQKKILKIALCGGAGFFLLPNAIAAGAQAYITSDIKYHDFFDADSTILLADIGHYESEQFTIDLLAEFLQQKFPNFAVLKTEIITNPVQYYS
ncbi:MAG: Nif3-like dinuclear metal center hexameric protein [Bacteroidota bacterium]|nr:Nif3-like dinuclear metal center hexameric protein [Bacteroidota bacterium]